MGSQVGNFHRDLTRAHWAALLAARYFSWRWVANALAYLRFPEQLAARSPRLAAASSSLVELSRQAVAAVALLADIILGISLQLPFLVVSFLPLSSCLHRLCLFHTTGGCLDSAMKKLLSEHADIKASQVPPFTQGLRKALSIVGSPRAAQAPTA